MMFVREICFMAQPVFKDKGSCVSGFFFLVNFRQVVYNRQQVKLQDLRQEKENYNE